MKQPLWTPSPERVEQSNMTAYLRQVNRDYGLSLASYDDLYQWSIDNIEEFWESIWNLSEIRHSQPYQFVLSEHRMPGAKWFQEARLNFARNLLRYQDDLTAIIGYQENGQTVRLSYSELYRNVASCALGLKKLGVGPGDRIAAFVPNLPEAVIAMLAATSLGAVWSSCSPDFGLQGVLDRFGQIAPKVFITCDGYRYLGKEINSLDRARRIASRLPNLQGVVVIPNLKTSLPELTENWLTWDQFLADRSDSIEFANLSFDHPVYIMYSSGTTGAPKCIVHGAGGTLLQHFKELYLHTDLKRQDVISYYTTCGWMMWNWLVSSLMIGASIVLYDGSPAHPNIDTLWRMIEREKLTVFGTSPRYLTACQHAELCPSDRFELTSLRTILSTGAPLSDENFNWVYRNVKSDLQLASISGGTDIISCFMLGNPMTSVYSEEIQGRGLGMKVEAFDSRGRSLVNETGELVCTAPFPSMPVSFWNDPSNTKYQSAYFDTYPGVWHHGDYIRITETGGVIVYGRSDATLNPGGVRIGTAEIYNPVEAMEEIADSVVVGQRWNGDIRIVLFVVPAKGHSLTDQLKVKIKDTIRKQASPRHVPSIILPIREVPRTLNGKKVELAVANVIHGEAVTNREALANPEALAQFERIAALSQPT